MSTPPVIDPRRIIGGIMLVLLLGSVNQTLVAAALPRIAERLDGFSLMAWVISAFLVAATVVTPIYGRLYDRYGVRVVLMGATAVFTVGSLGCALSTSMPMLIGFRALQGIGGGGLIAGAHSAVAQAVVPRERGRYQAWLSGTFAIGSILGPVAGGWITDRLTWHWVFAANVPLAIAAIVVVRERLRPLPVPGRVRPLDVAGSLLLAVGLAAWLIAITRAGQGLPWFDATNLRWLVIGAVLLAGYGWRELRAEDPVLPFRLMRNRVVALGLASQFLAHGTMIVLTVMVPLEMQVVSGLGPSAAGAQLLALSAGTPLGSILGGRVMTATGRYRPPQVWGAALNAVAVSGFAAAIALDAPHGAMLALLFAAGIGFGLQFPTTLVALQNATPPEYLGSVIAATNFGRSLGGALGIAGLSTVLLELLRSGAPELSAVSTGADVLRALTDGASEPLRERMQPVAERAFVAIFAICAATSLVVVAVFRAMPERVLRG